MLYFSNFIFDFKDITSHFTEAQKTLLRKHKDISTHEILVLILRLRQMCCHPALIHSMLDQHDAELNGLDMNNDEDINIIKKIGDMSMLEEEQQEINAVVDYEVDPRTAGNLLTKNNPVFHDDRQSSKVININHITHNSFHKQIIFNIFLSNLKFQRQEQL